MTRRNDKRNNRRNRQRNNNSELPPFAQMLFGAIIGKGAEMIAETLMDKAEGKPNDVPYEGTRKVGNHVESSVIVKNDGTATEIPVPDGYEVFISEDGKPMIRKKNEGEEKTPDAEEGNPITYDDICKKLFLGKRIFFINGKGIESAKAHDENYDDFDNCTSSAQVRRMAAFNKLQNIAKYLNGDWKPNFDDKEIFNWSIIKECGSYGAQYNMSTNEGSVYFKSADLAQEAIHLMGEDSLNDLFSTDW